MSENLYRELALKKASSESLLKRPKKVYDSFFLNFLSKWTNIFIQIILDKRKFKGANINNAITIAAKHCKRLKLKIKLLITNIATESATVKP